jgi:hypothetical protein
MKTRVGDFQIIREDSTAPSDCRVEHTRSNDQAEENQWDTEVGFNDDCVHQGMTNCHITVIGHYYKETSF